MSAHREAGKGVGTRRKFSSGGSVSPLPSLMSLLSLQVGMTAPGTRRHIYDTKLGTDKCDNSSMSLQMGYTQGANQSGQVFGLGRQIYDPKYCPQGPVAPSECPLYYRRRRAPEIPLWVVFPHHCSIWVFLFFVLFYYMSECYQLRVWGKGRKAIARCMWGGGPHQGSSRHQVSQQTLGQAVRLGRKRNPGREGNWP